MSAIVLQGDARSLPLPDASVDLIVTSPPYWSLRDYRDGGESLAGQIGSEETWQEYIANLLDCTREWVRVLKPEGSLFVVLGDKYSGAQQQTHGRQSAEASSAYWRRTDPKRVGVPAKSLIGLPWRYSLACIDELGLLLRAENIWEKLNGLPESAEDRTRRAHEQIFHITRQGQYFAAVDEIRELGNMDAHTLSRRSRTDKRLAAVSGGQTTACNALGRLPGSVWGIAAAPLKVPEWIEHGRCCAGRKRTGCEDGLNHHAAFPPALARKCILGWSPSGICMGCGEGRAPITAGGRTGDGSKPHKAAQRVASFDWAAWKGSAPKAIIGYACACTPFHWQEDDGARWKVYHLATWTPPPSHPAIVLDPFGGTGTTALTADMLGRNGLSFELSADYCRLARWRTRDPGERARALGVPKPPPVPDGQTSLFGEAS